MKSRVPILIGAMCALFAITAVTYCYTESFAPPTTGTATAIADPGTPDIGAGYTAARSAHRHDTILARIDRALDDGQPRRKEPLTLQEGDAILSRSDINDTPFVKAMVLDWKTKLAARDACL